jgi:hypothetical protein
MPHTKTIFEAFKCTQKTWLVPSGGWLGLLGFLGWAAWVVLAV